MKIFGSGFFNIEGMHSEISKKSFLTGNAIFPLKLKIQKYIFTPVTADTKIINNRP